MRHGETVAAYEREFVQKKCTKCGVAHPLESYDKYKRSPDGKRSVCKSCRAAHYAQNRESIRLTRKESETPESRAQAVKRAAQWAKAHPERVREFRNNASARVSLQRRAKYASFPDKAKERARQYRLRNSDIVRIKSAKRRATEEARDKAREDSTRRRKENPERYRAYSLAHVARRRWAGGGGISYDERTQIMASTCGLCSYCSRSGDLEMDHIVPLKSGGEHDPSNTAPACVSCNTSKSATLLLIWLARKAQRRAA